MTQKYSLMPPERERQAAKIWLLAALSTPGLTNSSSFPMSFTAYIDDRRFTFFAGSWEMGADSVYLARPSDRDRISTLVKISLLMLAAQHANLIEVPEIKEAFLRAFSREVIGGYKEFVSGLAFSKGEVVSVALHETGAQTAIKFADAPGYFKANGEEIQLEGDGWIIIEGTEPVTTV